MLLLSFALPGRVSSAYRVDNFLAWYNHRCSRSKWRRREDRLSGTASLDVPRCVTS